MREKAWEHHNTSSHHEDGFVGFRIVLQDDIVKINDFQQKKLVKIFEDHEVTFDEVGTWFEELEILEPTSSKQNQGPNDVYMERYSGEENLVENTHDPVQEQQIDEAELFPGACDPKTEHVIPKRSLFLKHVIPKRSLPRSQFAGSRVPDTARGRQDPVWQHGIFNTSSQEEGRVCGGSVAFDQVGSIRPSNNDPGETQGGMIESSAKQEDLCRHGARQTSWPSRCTRTMR